MDFLNFIAEACAALSDVRFAHARRGDRVDRGERTHLSACARRTADGELEVRADLTVGCDGRHSTVRAEAGLESDDYGAPMDVMWFSIVA